MSEHNDLLPLRSPEEGGLAFELVRRGYDRDQVENHLAWLEDQLRNAEAARDAAEQAAASASSEAETAREELERNRPLWYEFGDRVTQILTLAEEQGAEIRALRVREADELLAEARQASIDTDRSCAARLREAEEQAAHTVSTAQAEAAQIMATAQADSEQMTATAQSESEQMMATAQSESEQMMATAHADSEQLMTTAQAEADRMLARSQQQVAEEERAATRRLNELERQRDAVNAQLTRLHEALAHALTPPISVQDAPYEPEEPTALVDHVELPSDEYPTTLTDTEVELDYQDEDYDSPAAPADSTPAARSPRATRAHT